MSVIMHSNTAGSKSLTTMGKGPPLITQVWMAHGTASARKTFWTLAPRALAIAMLVFPCFATTMPEKTLGNDVPAAATVKPRTVTEIPKSSWIPSQAATTEKAKMANQNMLITKETGYKCCNLGLSMSGMVSLRKNLTGNWSHSAHSISKAVQLWASGASTFPRRCSLSAAQMEPIHALVTAGSLAPNSKVIRLPKSELCWCTCSAKCASSAAGSQ
mmetsp:Transcript_43517/g.87726  ORF Transcript_43517/g.87726 Transcript_43517/m.87726 type:complete len:216 (+) Transcript_43517:535-1182(+)